MNMRINVFSTSNIITTSKKNTNKSNIISTLENYSSTINKTSTTNEQDVINTGLDKINDATDSYNGTYPAIYQVLNDLYKPIEDILKTLSLNASTYTKDTNALKSSDLSEDARNTIQSELNSSKENIMYLTSPEQISQMDDYIAAIKYQVDPLQDTLNRLEGKTGDDSDTNSITVNSMEDLGLSSNKNSDFKKILLGIQNAENNFDEKMSITDDTNSTYGELSNKGNSSILNIYA